MMKTNCLIVLSFFSALAFSQDTTLTKEEMYEDFDYLVEKIKTINPSLEIKKELFHYSIIDTILTFRKEIENCNHFYDFHLLTIKMMNTCLDGHSSITSLINWLEVKLYIPLIYRNGKYLVKRKFTCNNTIFNAGISVVAINGNNKIHEEISNQVPFRYLMRWDNEKKIFYSEIFFWSSKYIKDGKITIDFKTEDDTISSEFKMNEQVEFEGQNSPTTKIDYQVAYFEKEKALYIRVPTMDWSTRNFYTKEIQKVARGKMIDKVVIDVRNNAGGSSLVGRNIFRSIIADPITLNYRNFGNNPSYLTKRYKRQHTYSKQIQLDSLNELNGIPMYAFVNRVETIKPFKNSIQHKGAIFIIGNEHVYSAGGAIFAFANTSKTDNIYSIGTPTGWFLGEFSDPIHFTLPNSKLNGIIPPAVSMTNVSSWNDVMLDSYDYTVYPSLNDYEIYYNFKGSIYSEDFLLNYDPYFKLTRNK